MKLSRLRIAHFRAIRNADLKVDGQLALVGQNSAGKTSILRGLNAFFNFESEKSAFELGQHTFQRTSFAVIDVTFSEVPANCPLPRSAPSEVRARLRFRKQAQWQIHNGQEWVAAPLDLHEVLGKHIAYVFIPLRRDHEVAGWGPDGLMEQVVEASFRSTRQRDHITPAIQRLGEKLKRQSLDSLAVQLRSSTPMSGEFQYALDYETSPDYAVLLKNLVLHVREGNQTVRLSDAGSGTQSLAVFALYSYLASVENSTYVLGFEEPEQNLHPQAQVRLLAWLKTLGLQVIFTTHSPTMIDALDHEDVALCRRTTSPTRDIETQVSQLPDDFFVSRGLDRDDYYRFHRRKNSEFFFADFVLVTESPIDMAVISQVMDDAEQPLSESNISGISLDGVGSLSYVFHLLSGLNIQSGFVVDKDYFLPYLNGELEQSRGSGGFPKYAQTLKSDTVVDWLFPKVSDRTKFEAALSSNHARAEEMLRQVGWHCFRWSLEADLVATKTTRTKLFGQFGISGAMQTTDELLVGRKKALKKQDTLVRAVTGVATTGLPRSYRGIRAALKAVAE